MMKCREPEVRALALNLLIAFSAWYRRVSVEEAAKKVETNDPAPYWHELARKVIEEHARFMEINMEASACAR